MTDPNWIASAISAARPQAMGALLRYFRDLDTAEEAFQDACLRALKNWPKNGPPRDPAAWLIFVGRNSGIDGVRKRSKQVEMPDEDKVSDLDDVEEDMAERLDGAHYRDDILRLLFICCHPDLPATQQIALALRIVSGLSVKQIARAFLVGESAMEQRITRAKARIGTGALAFETPGAVERSERLAAVAAMIYLVFNEGYSTTGGEAVARAPLAEEAIRLARLLLRLFQTEPEIMGLTALMLLQHARAPARFDANGEIVLLEDQDRSLWRRKMIDEGLALVDKALRHAKPGPYQVQAAIAAGDAEPRRRRLQGARAADGARHGRSAGRPARRLFPFPRPARRPVDAARPQRRGTRSLRPGDRTGQHGRGGLAYPHAHRPADEGRQRGEGGVRQGRSNSA
jgi:RNA polymerase sigma-70 factor (ECF subfamily)